MATTLEISAFKKGSQDSDGCQLLSDGETEA